MTRMQTYVFISYSRADKFHASQISKILNKCKTEHFLDSKEIGWGGDIEADVVAAITRSSHLLIIVSPSSLESLWVGYEIGHAKALGKKIIPFLVYPTSDVPTLISRLNFYADLGRVESYFQHLSKISEKTQNGSDLERVAKKLSSPRTGNATEEREAVREDRNRRLMDAINQKAA